MILKSLAASTIAATLLLIASPAQASDPIIGSSGDHISGTALHRFGQLTGSPITDADFVNIETTVDWLNVAAGNQDAALRRWADALKNVGPVFVSWSHEPMAKQNTHWGTAATFIASFKHVVSVFNSRGATNVQWVWNVTSNSFRVQTSSSEYGSKWYPGDSYVDFVAGEAYNRYQCGSSTSKSVGTQVNNILAFARSHSKRLIVAEFASNAWSGRAQWLRDAKAFIHNNNLRGAFYYNSSSTQAGKCKWRLTEAEKDIVRSM